ncbi:hypothetical protein [Pontibacter burrus]|uniref:Lipoprotein n=1 Tax=Pontibacter burrus TaxID=2704466 RepID=A0A6B3LL53_9BACT|nr:hypothetical protein [Pontibacter burrus]NEM97519.1 hypothetical protein [Pontibacter burrus]
MYQNLKYPLLLLLATATIACNSGSDEDKGIASTHPKLEKQLSRDSVNALMRNGEHAELYDHYRITTDEYMNSGNYNVPTMFRGKLAPIDERSHRNARDYVIALREGMKQGINFAGKYTVVTVGCGTTCQRHFIVDRESGKVVDMVQSSTGAKFSENSRIFIVNPPDSTLNYNECRYCTPEVYELADGKLKKVEDK